ncbi:21625_t:CDS:2 [Cetraspora pellucida]|uniref:21625_t:CDS:1 n=1 Tax=Cetraspora pellucida TaxID=1433469 RepID=A0A9N9DXZ1_9GLOM|nr:21625_t:CDS:2 [Cetraspora pellucida]
MWSLEKEQLLRKKGIDLDIYVSNFLIEMIELLKDDLKKAYVMMVLGSCIFAFDNIIAYKAFAENAFVSSKMNLFLDGFVPKM